jgi:hypothetical protein
MTRILISAATLIALTMSAAASPLPAKYYLSKMPQQFRGEWCAQHLFGLVVPKHALQSAL